MSRGPRVRTADPVLIHVICQTQITAPQSLTDTAFPILGGHRWREHNCTVQLQIDTKQRKISYTDFALQQNRFRRLKREYASEFDAVMAAGEQAVTTRYEYYRMLAGLDYSKLASVLDSAAGDVSEADLSKTADYRP